MALDISAAVTANFPRTEAMLMADETANRIDYDTLKQSAIDRAIRDAYGSRTAPAESLMEEIVARSAIHWATMSSIRLSAGAVLLP